MNNKGKKMSAFALSPIYQSEIIGSLSLHHTEMTIQKTDGLLAVGVCSNLVFLGTGDSLSGIPYEIAGSHPVQFLRDLL